MVCRPPTLNGTPRPGPQPGRGRSDARRHATSRWSAPGSPCGAETFGQCIDAVRALDVDWTDGPGRRRDRRDHPARSSAGAELPLAGAQGPTRWPRPSRGTSRFYFRSSSALDAVRRHRRRPRRPAPTVWAGLKSPIVAQQRHRQGARPAARPGDGQRRHRRRLLRAPSCSSTPRSRPRRSPRRWASRCKLMWHRADEPASGRGCTRWAPRRVQATYARPGRCSPSSSATPAWRPTSATGSARCITAKAADLPGGLGNQGFAETIFALTQEVPYDFGAVTPDAHRDRRPLQHRLHAQHLLTRRPRRPASWSSTSSPRRWAWTRYEFRLEFVKRRRASSPRSTRSPRSATGAARCRPARRRASRSTRSTRASPRASSRSTAARRPSTGRSARPSPGRGSPR